MARIGMFFAAFVFGGTRARLCCIPTPCHRGGGAFFAAQGATVRLNVIHRFAMALGNGQL